MILRNEEFMTRTPLLLRLIVATLVALAFSTSAYSQQIAFGGIRGDSTAPVEITSDSLTVDQSTGIATFAGNVVIGQGGMRLSAGQVLVEYGETTSDISKLRASGGVTLVSETEAAEAREAVYTLANSTVVLSGDVLLTQGQNVMAGESLTVNLTTGTGTMAGRVRTVLQPGGK
jgi:lipopolysaccharide export system protein LptA